VENQWILKNTDAFKQLGTCKGQALLLKLREAWGSFYALKRLERIGQLSPHVRRVSPPRYVKDRKTRRRMGESIYVRNDGYRQAEDTLVLSKTLRIRFKAGELCVGKQGRLELDCDRLREKWYGRIPVRVKLHNFCMFAQIRQRIHEPGEEYGIHVRFKSERGTSKRC
jgi:putative transposase